MPLRLPIFRSFKGIGYFQLFQFVEWYIRMHFKFLLLFFLFSFSFLSASGQQAGPFSSAGEQPLWHGIKRSIRYIPHGGDFIITNGTRRFNRALYGTNTGFRVEAGDLPQFALYMPGMGGSLKFGLITTDTSKWLVDAERITARYRPGAMLYEIEDPLLVQGRLKLNVLARDDAEGILVQVVSEGVGEGVELFWSFGGATGKRFHRDGDIGADPESSFYLKPEYCGDNIYEIEDNHFVLHYGSGKVLTEAERHEIQHRASDKLSGESFGRQKQLAGTVPPGMRLQIADAAKQNTPAVFWDSGPSNVPAVAGKLSIRAGEPLYFSIHNPDGQPPVDYSVLPALFGQAEAARKKLAGRVKLRTPDPYVNPFGGALAVAADAIWEHPSYLHGAVAWRMRLNGWRGAYAADPLGWHGRARAHFSAYALSQLASPETGPVTPDTALNFARQQETLGTALFSSGYICRNPGGDFRAHHYDMNLVFIDQLLRHFQWTGDLDYAREMWPVLQRHLAWEKRCFDGDGDGLYDAYCSIWASDALEYSGGGVAHSSAYNYLANRMAAKLAKLIGENPAPYRQEAEKILSAVNSKLWMPSLGWYAEFKDALGNQFLHPSPGLWTVYHAIDSGVPGPFQAYQALRYVDTQIPHIPVRAEGAPAGLYTLSTTNWMPYTWSVNNVAMAEVLHAALAYWQAGRKEEAFRLWKSAVVESMYLGASPGSFQQLSFYDAFRGELYRDFADPVGMAARTLVEGLFGIRPDALNGMLAVQPGLPDEWDEASLEIPGLNFQFERSGNTERYAVAHSLPGDMKLRFRVKARTAEVKSAKVNGVEARWKSAEGAVGFPVVEITAGAAARYEIEIEWEGSGPEAARTPAVIPSGGTFSLQWDKAEPLEVFDPQQALEILEKGKKLLTARAAGSNGHRTAFVRLRQGDFSWWAPLDFEIRAPVTLLPAGDQPAGGLSFRIQNNTASPITVSVRGGHQDAVLKDRIPAGAGALSGEIVLKSLQFVSGTNPIRLEWGGGNAVVGEIVNWNIKSPADSKWETVDLSAYFNDNVTEIFKHRYESPRVPYPTVQIPLQGIGNWCYPLVEADIDDTGLRALAGTDGVFGLPQGMPFATPGPGGEKNIVFTSMWDNFPEAVSIPLSGRASHAYLLMTGATNPMQSRLDNGVVEVEYEDGSKSVLPLRNPDTWWPIEQDYYRDGYAFDWDHPFPPRVHLKTGLITRKFDHYTSIKGFSDRVIDGGAATVLDLPLEPGKALKSLKVRALANEVVIGLMGVTLVR